MLQVNDLRKKYGRVEVLRGLDLTLNSGDVYGFLGRNGAGMTTAMRSVIGVHNVDPHQPLSFARKAEKGHPTRIFRIEGDTKVVVVIMRAIYQLRQITELPEKSSLVVTDAQPRLDAAEALLAELGLLAK